MAYNQTLEERETIIRTDEASDEWEIYTQNPRLMRLFGEFHANFPGLCRLKAEDDKWHSKTFSIAKTAISIRPKRPQTEEQKAAMRERAIASGFAKRITE